jgi:flagellar basal body-associated protein FliL
MAEKEQKKPEAAAEKKDDGGHGGGAAGATKKAGGIGAMLGKMPVLLGGVMIVEAVVLFGGLKMLGFGAAKETVAAELIEGEAGEHGDGHGEAGKDGGDHGSGGGEHGDGEHADGAKEGEKGKDGAPGPRKHGKKEVVEMPVVELRAPNKQSGRTFLYDISIFAVTRGEHVEKLTRTLKDREALIRDRVRTIIAQSDPEKLGGGSEPGLETLRRQVKYQLDEIVGEGLIDEVLVPRCMPFRTDY